MTTPQQDLGPDDIVIIDGARTPVGRFNGALAGFSLTDLGAAAIAGALDATGLAPEQIDKVIMGNVLAAGAGQSPARNAAVKAGIPLHVDAITTNKACLSGLNAIQHASMLIQTGFADVVMAGGMESMTTTPHLLMKGRNGYGYGHGQLIDSLMHDGLTCAIESKMMGEATDLYGAEESIGREEQDVYAARSHRRAAAATESGALSSEIAPIMIPQRKGDPIEFSTDEGIRADSTPESLARLRAAFVEDGNVTAGNASQLSDGASATVVTSRRKAEELGVEPLATVLGYGMVAGPDNCSLIHQPARAIRKAAERASIDIGAIELFEINEAFASVAIGSIADLGVSDEIVNVNGGAIALGHPVGMSGNRVALTLMHELKRRGGGIGAAGLCGGGGQGDAIILSV